MRSTLDRRVLSNEAIELVRALQRRAPCHLAGGTALSAAYLAHRLSGDVDLFAHDRGEMRDLVRALPDVAQECRATVEVVRDTGHLVRATVATGTGRRLALDLVHESVPDLLPPPPAVEEVVLESLPDLRASKLTCILSRTEPRDLVDLYFLDQAGFPPELDLPLALRKDAGIDPGVLSWLLERFPVRPLPIMLSPLTEEQLASFRDALRERLRRAALPAC